MPPSQLTAEHTQIEDITICRQRGRSETYLGTTCKAATSASCLKATGYASSQCPQADTQPRTENLGIMTESKQPWLARPVSGAPSRVRPRTPRAQTKSCPSATYNMNNRAYTPRNPMISRTARGWRPKVGGQLLKKRPFQVAPPDIVNVPVWPYCDGIFAVHSINNTYM